MRGGEWTEIMKERCLINAQALKAIRTFRGFEPIQSFNL